MHSDTESSLLLLQVSYHFKEAAPISTIKHYHAKAVLQHLYVIDGVYRFGVWKTFQIDGSPKVLRHHAAHIVVAVVTERLTSARQFSALI